MIVYKIISDLEFSSQRSRCENGHRIYKSSHILHHTKVVYLRDMEWPSETAA